MKKVRASVIIINYNGFPFLEELLETLETQTFQDFEVLFVDNASQDDSVEFVSQRGPDIRILPLEKNCGFSRAGNYGAGEARGDFLVFLNTDMKLAPEWLENLCLTAETSEDAAAVASKMRLYDRPDILNGVGGCMNRLGYTWDRGMYQKDNGQYDQPAEVLFASAGAALFRAQVFRSLGGFDERFFMYHEDVDLGWRLWLAGSRVITAPKAIVYHHFGGSTRESRSLRWRETQGERNNMRSLIKNYEARNVQRAIQTLLTLRQPPLRKVAQLRNFLWNLFWLPDTLKERRRVQSTRQRSDQELERLILQTDHVPFRL